MSVNLYRLYAIQDFGKRIDTGGKKVAVYVNDGNFPDTEILTDAEELAQKLVTRKELFDRKAWMYKNDGNFSNWSPKQDMNRVKLKYYQRVFERARKLIDDNESVNYAIFVNSTNKKDWHGEKTLYFNNVLDEVKSDTPIFSACRPVKTVKL